jgi:galactokinase/mevalonate kinase-like predicted kinase
LRVDFGGGWLDVPKFSQPNAYIVNCAITPKVSLVSWPYEKGAGLGGSAAYAFLQVKSGVKSEINAGVGWQDPAIIAETGLCVWRSGKKPVLDMKANPDWLNGKMLIVWTGNDHIAPNITNLPRDYKGIKKAGLIAKEAVYKKDLKKLAQAIKTTYGVQIREGMKPLPNIKNSLANKYLGAGHGGYALYLFASKTARDRAFKNTKKSIKIEPYIQAHE